MSSNALRIAYFGLPLGALALHRAGISLCAIALGHPDAPGALRVRRRLSARSLVLAKPDLQAPAVLRTLEALKPDVILSWFWPRLIPEAVLDLAPQGAFGVHPSLLPRWRGPDPYFWALSCGDSHTGVTLHRLAAEYDTGHIVAQHRVPVLPHYNAWTLAKALDKPSLQLLVSAALALRDGESLPGLPQDETDSSEAPQPSEDMLELRWRRPVATLLRQIRALAPHPGAGATLGNEAVEVLGAAAYDRKLPKALTPGDAVLTTRGVVICVKDGGLVLTRVRRPDSTLLSGLQIAELFPSGLFKLPE